MGWPTRFKRGRRVWSRLKSSGLRNGGCRFYLLGQISIKCIDFLRVFGEISTTKGHMASPPLPPKTSLSLHQLGMWPGRKSLARRIGCTSGFPNWWCYTGGVPWLLEPCMWNDGSISHAYPFFLHVYLQKRHGKVKMFFFKMEHRTSWYLLEAKSVHWKLQCPGCFVHDARTLLDILGQSAWKQIHNPLHVFGRRTHTIAASQALLDGHGILKAMDKFNLSKPKPNQEHTWDACTSKNIS